MSGYILGYIVIGVISTFAYLAVNESDSEAKEAFVVFALWPIAWGINAWAGIRRYAHRRLR